MTFFHRSKVTKTLYEFDDVGPCSPCIQCSNGCNHLFNVNSIYIISVPINVVTNCTEHCQIMRLKESKRKDLLKLIIS